MSTCTELHNTQLNSRSTPSPSMVLRIRKSSGTAFAASALAACLLNSTSAHAANTNLLEGRLITPQWHAGAKSKRSQQVRILPSQNNSGETPAQRDRRLYRECRGLPNSGACAGYAYGPSGRR